MKLVSQGAQYAISAIIAISKHENDVISASELSRSLNCPAAYLSQILSKLKAPGILKSQRGLNGGVYLANHWNKFLFMMWFLPSMVKSFLTCVLWELKAADISSPVPSTFLVATAREYQRMVATNHL